MPTLLSRGVDFLTSRIAPAAEETVRIERPATGEVIPEVQAAPGSQDFTVDDGESSSLAYRTYDWLMEAAAYNFGAGPVEPADGDRLIVARGVRTETYEVLRIPGAKSWRYSDPYNRRYRIHCKLIERT